MSSGLADLGENSDLPRGFLYLVENRYVSPAIRRAHLEVAHTPGWAVPNVELFFIIRPVLWGTLLSYREGRIFRPRSGVLYLSCRVITEYPGLYR